MVVCRAPIVFGLLICQILLTTSDDAETSPSAPPCDEQLSVEILNGHMLPNGSILAPNKLLYEPGQFWTTDLGQVRGCICQLKHCIRKCCPDNHLYHRSIKGMCVPKNHPLLRPFPPIEHQVGDRDDIHVLFGDVCKFEKYFGDEITTYEFDSDGNLLSSNESYAADQYCMELFFESDNDTAGAAITMFPCAMDDEEEEVSTAHLVFYSLGMIVSLPFLLATFLVYAIIPELRNIHGKNLMSHVTTMFVAYLFLSIVQLSGKSITPSFCVASAFIIYFSFLACFFWLNIMCFDLWWTFSGFKPLRGSVRERDHKKFILYSLYCWGSALIMLVVALSMHFTGPQTIAEVLEHRYVVPGFGLDNCWFYGTSAIWAYFYGPVATILTVNLIMFITTAFKIVQLKKETAMLKGSDSKRHDDDENKQRFSLYLKLFIVMGVNWAMEVISAAVGGPDYIWLITDFGNTIQGVLIFIIFVWKDKVRKLIRRRFESSDSKSMANSYSQSTRVFSSTRSSSVRNTSLSTTEFNMVPMTSKEP